MKIGVYFCNCGSNISDKVDSQQVRQVIEGHGDVAYFKTNDLMCSDDGKQFLSDDLAVEKPDRIVIAACSPREHENTFMRVLTGAGMNPYLMQMVNIREQVAWVTDDVDKASAKAAHFIKGAVKRVGFHKPLEKKSIDMSPDVLIIGAGPAGLKAALTIAETGRKVTLVEKSPAVGGQPVLYEEVFPNLECAPCMLEPILNEILHGEHAENIEILTMSEVVELTGFYGNFIAQIKKTPRYADLHQCIGCGECVSVCPVDVKNEFNNGLDDRKAISLSFAGALPNVPFIDMTACLRAKGEDCRLCEQSCPLGEGIILYDDAEEIVERRMGAVIVAVGASLYDAGLIPKLGIGTVPDVYTSFEFERLLSSTGPTGGQLVTSSGKVPESIALIHCVGSLDSNHKEYCSGVCCQSAFKFNLMVEHKLHDTHIHHLYKELVYPGKEEFFLYKRAKENPNAVFTRYRNIASLEITAAEDKEGGSIIIKNTLYEKAAIKADMVVLCPAMVPAKDTGKLNEVLGTTSDVYGFFEELHGRLDSVRSKVRGIYIAGACQSPMNIAQAMTQGMAAAGYVLNGLVQGKQLEIEPITASVDEERCSGCRICMLLCPYRAISFDAGKKKSMVNEVLCQGCGTCVAACPAGAMNSNHFTNEAIFAEIEGVLA
ncbi:MAG: CoB--CoM heterodisulfide reductase iron-sulfur subunit A family protein [Nitrospirae bacterium]|nr:CoB--CoM heterodisulfide reductase iron-sulfur subunit A family protein [Nitrospirota bacterium]MBF0535927.1 CoB--CoM heterodisulfide reductase iron-sulfur subunit A family protein [Nitrospirota bacterium]MBF0617741.1 CoB--CoM heterodisulfide reductase iron-sulfur subunit A family protein [Nitrospirota bacterium]